MPHSRWKQLLERIGRLFIPPRGAEPDPEARSVRLPDGTPAIVRPIRPTDAAAMVEALAELSPQSRYQRFLSHVDRLTPAQLDYLTHADGVNHLALGMAVVPSPRARPKPVAIARCIRDRTDPELAEVAIVVADEWHRRGVGTLLLRHLAADAQAVGIRRWKAVMLGQNVAAFRLLDRLGERRSQRWEGAGVAEVIYDLRPPVATVGSAAPRESAPHPKASGA